MARGEVFLALPAEVALTRTSMHFAQEASARRLASRTELARDAQPSAEQLRRREPDAVGYERPGVTTSWPERGSRRERRARRITARKKSVVTSRTTTATSSSASRDVPAKTSTTYITA